MKLRSIELVLPDASAAAAFMTDIWGMAEAELRGSTHYLRGAGPFPYLVAFAEGTEPFVRTTTFVCSRNELAALEQRVSASGLPSTPTTSTDPGGGRGLIVELPEGELFRFLTDATEVAPLAGRDLPVQLTHVVLNSTDAEATALAAERALGFRVSDRTKGMVFVRCNESHHSTAFARAGLSSLNHIAFEMQDFDAVMRGIGRLRDHKYIPAWGPGRHGPGANVFAYFIAPFNAVVEFSTAVEKVSDDYRTGAPEDWTWPANRIDQWGLSDKAVDRLRRAEETFRFRREWTPAAASQSPHGAR
jgi:catechol 2,3-dioxygenase-like lactoylglutathione lyase family enzyme